MNLHELAKQVKDGSVTEINLVSMEGGSYVMHALASDISTPVAESNGATLHVASVEEARKLLSGLDGVQLFLVQAAVHDEMVGLQDDAGQAAREPIPLRSSL
ncbi:DUF6482 family protein [Pseudomonas sp. nanlin1]|uniref:DUF6482 family protein n=1 Tax=Pseudomonas sp. nanlin1 TaxID=3040605 RepID=UPI0038903E19